MFLKESKKLKKLFTANNRSLESDDYLQSSRRYDFAIGISFNLLIISAFVNDLPQNIEKNIYSLS